MKIFELNILIYSKGFCSYLGFLLSTSFSLKHRSTSKNKSLGEEDLQCLITAARQLQ